MTIGIATWQDYVTHAVQRRSHVAGSLKILKDLWSPQLHNRRDVLVYLPPSYAHGERRYPVIYMQDGQNLFDPATSFGGVTWRVDETMDALSHEGLEAMVVGVHHAGEQRISEYSPFAIRRPGRGEQYVTFLVETVKPLMDATFRTLPAREHTGIIGSSMGGLISLYAFFHRSRAFGFAGALSPALWVGRGAMYDFVAQTPFVNGKLYLDNGSRENSAWRMYQWLRRKGYQRRRDICYVREKGAIHHESAWARRLPNALRFMLTPIR